MDIVQCNILVHFRGIVAHREFSFRLAEIRAENSSGPEIHLPEKCYLLVRGLRNPATVHEPCIAHRIRIDHGRTVPVEDDVFVIEHRKYRKMRE